MPSGKEFETSENDYLKTLIVVDAAAYDSSQNAEIMMLSRYRPLSNGKAPR
jgi:hypothetical protein